MVGSAKNVVSGKGGAAAYRSTDGGTSWSLVSKDTSITGWGASATTRAAALNGKMYLQARDMMEGAPLRVFNGTSWSTLPSTPCDTVEARAVEVFKGRIICGNYAQGIVAFDGMKATPSCSRRWTPRPRHPWYGYIYALSRGGVYRSADGLSWTGLTTVPDYAWSIGVHNGTIYLGERLNATIRKVDGLNTNTLDGNDQHHLQRPRGC